MFKKFWNYLFSKREEIKDLDEKDVYLAKFVADANRKTSVKTFEFINLSKLYKIHRLDRDTAMEKVRERIDILEKHKEEIIKEKNISREFLKNYLPSISWMKVIKENDDSYISFEGNGRLEAMKDVFSDDDGIKVEVELYEFKDQETMIRRANRVRKYNNLI